MGYSVDYKPTNRRRAKRAVPRSKAQRTKDIKNAIRWNIRQLEHDTVGADTIARSLAISMLRLNKIAPTADPAMVEILSGVSAGDTLFSPGKPKATRP